MIILVLEIRWNAIIHVVVHYGEVGNRVRGFVLRFKDKPLPTKVVEYGLLILSQLKYSTVFAELKYVTVFFPP